MGRDKTHQSGNSLTPLERDFIRAYCEEVGNPNRQAIRQAIDENADNLDGPIRGERLIAEIRARTCG